MTGPVFLGQTGHQDPNSFEPSVPLITGVHMICNIKMDVSTERECYAGKKESLVFFHGVLDDSLLRCCLHHGPSAT